MSRFPMLMSPFKIGSMEVRNRMILPAMETHLCDKEGFVTDSIISYYRERAKGGVGYITVENTSVAPAGRINDGMLCVHDDKYIPGLKRLVEAVHREQCKIVVQLNHAGKEALSFFTGMEIVAPSPISSPITRCMPRELSTKEVKELVEKFAQAAERVYRSGADGVEIHMAHGYLVCQFLSPESNIRTDEYGGSTEARVRFAKEIVESIRKRLPKDYPVICRISADEYTETGIKLEESKKIARVLEASGASALHVSACNSTSAFYNIPCYYMDEGCFVHLAEAIKRHVKVPVIAVGRILKPAMAEKIIEEGKADFVSMGRALIADPHLPRKIREGRLEDIKPCVSCNRCIESIVENKLVCTVNPLIGREIVVDTLPTASPKKILVVGGGPGGLAAAAVARARGHEVTLWEKESVLGGKARFASMAPRKEPLKDFLNYLIRQVSRVGVKVSLNKEATVESVKQFNPDAVILATGSKDELLDIPGVGQNNLLNIKQAFLRADSVGKRVAVIGAGPEGCELADFLAERGRKVTLIEMKRIIGIGLVAHPRYHVGERLKRAGVDILTNTKVVEIGHGYVVINRRREANQRLEGFDSIVMSSLHKPNPALVEPLRSAIKELYVVGDAVGGRTALEAVAEGTQAALSV